MKRVLIASTVVMTILSVAIPAEARVVVVDRGSAREGTSRSQSPPGSVDRPRALFVQVKSRPTGQRVDVFWNVVCSAALERAAAMVTSAADRRSAVR